MADYDKDKTRSTLLERARNLNDSQAWIEMDAQYRPLLTRYAKYWKLSTSDIEDVVQHVLSVIAARIKTFEYDRNRGGFRRWLRTVTNNRIREMLKKKKEKYANTDFFNNQQNRDKTPEEAWEIFWLIEQLKRNLEIIRSKVEPHTFQAFKRYVIDECSVDQICDELNLEAHQVHLAKNRITNRLRDMMADTKDIPAARKRKEG